MYSRVHIRTSKRDFGFQVPAPTTTTLFALLRRARPKAVSRADSRTVCAAHQTTMNSPKVIASVAQTGCT